MRQSFSGTHINPVQTKLHSPGAPQILRQQNVLVEHPRIVEDPPHNGSKKDSSMEKRQKLQFAIQVPLPPQSPPTNQQILFLRTAQSNFLTHSTHSNGVAAQSPIRSRSPAQISNGKNSVIVSKGPEVPKDKIQTSVGKSNSSISSAGLRAHIDKMGILYRNTVAAMQQQNAKLAEEEQKRMADSRSLMKSSLQQLYEQLHNLRKKVIVLEQRDKSISEAEKLNAEKEKAIKDQLAQQRQMFEDYDQKIKTLHTTVQNYERRQKDLLGQISQKETQIEKQSIMLNCLKVEVAQLTVKNNILQSQLRKTALQIQDTFSLILQKLGFEGNRLGGVQSVLSKVDQYCVAHRQLSGRYKELVQVNHKKEEELVRTKQKVTQLVKTFYAQISKSNSQNSQLKAQGVKVQFQKQQVSKLLTQQKTRLQDQLSELNDSMEKLSKQNQQYKDQINWLQKSNSELNNQLALIRTSLNSSQCSCPTLKQIVSNNKLSDSLANTKLEEILSSIFSTATH